MLKILDSTQSRLLKKSDHVASLVKILHWLYITCRIKSKPSTHCIGFSVIWLLLLSTAPSVVNFMPVSPNQPAVKQWHTPCCTWSWKPQEPLFILQFISLKWFLFSEALPETLLPFFPASTPPIFSALTPCFYSIKYIYIEQYNNTFLFTCLLG